MKKLSLLLFIASINFQCGTSEQKSPLDLEIDEIENGLLGSIQVKGEPWKTFSIKERMEQYNIPGASIAVVKDGEIRWAKGYGIANTESGTKVDENTLFQAGSISKPVAALAALKLWEEGKVDLDEDVNTYLTDWKVEENTFTEQKKVTLRLLLTHSAGMTVHGFPGYSQTDTFPSINAVLNGEGNTAKIFPDTIPGSLWRYSGGGYTVMEKVVEDVSGMPLEQYMAEQILPTLGMSNSTYNQPIGTEFTENISAAYRGDGSLIPGLWNNYPEQAAAGLWTTPVDLANYCIQVQEILKGKADGVLKKSTIEAMLTKHLNEWGLGPGLMWDGDSLRFQHGGKNEGFTNNMVAFAHKGIAVIIMTNADRGGELMGDVMRSISSYYDLGLMSPKEIALMEMSEEVLEGYAGKYVYDQKVDNIGDYIVSLKVEGNKLVLDDPNNGQIDWLAPTAEFTFTDVSDGDEMVFKDGVEIPEFMWNDTFRFVKME